MIPYIAVDGIKITNGQAIVENFGSFHANLGANLALSISPGHRHTNDYMDQIPRMLNSVWIAGVTRLEIERAIDGLPNKTSSGCDNISNTLLKTTEV